ncbi:PDZ domain-containing protein [Akkermansiaceae bacterium]|nr:PDZ domain-containing protein [Akkermansiaceae bacterium]
MKQAKPQSPRAIAASWAAIALAFAPSAQAQGEQNYYTPENTPIFNPFPENTGRNGSRPWLVRNLGPVGIGINLIRPGMTMQIHNVEPGSPAEKTGKLKKGQIIESINGRVLEKIDPRIILGDIITEAEAKDGSVVLKIKDEGDVTVNIPVMGAYSPTWPVNCPKSDKIVRNLADLIAKQDAPKWGSVIFLLSTGEDKDLEVVKRWMKDIKNLGGMNWSRGYMGWGLCEYYLRTGDASVLPIIKQETEELRKHMFSGGWSGRGAPASFTYSVGTGQVHASGVNCMTFLIMAKLCGVEVDKYMFDETFSQFYRFAGHGNVAYGNTLPEGGFRDNGKTSGLALGLGAAAMVDPKGEDSVFAKARDNSAMKAFYATNWFHAAHTGGGMGEIWHHAAVSQMREKRPTPYRSYLDTRRWVMDLSRRFDGGIGIAGMDDRYDRSATEDNMDWGTFFALTYTYPRKTLQLFGAPRSKFAKNMPLERPWGNAADDAFHSIEPIPGGGPLTLEDLLNETVVKDASVAAIAALTAPDLADETLLRYIQHPEYDLRSMAMDQVVRRGKVELVVPLLKSDDPRLRQAGLLALTGMFKGSPLPPDKVTPEMLDLAGRMVENPDESWWVALHAINALARANPEVIAKHRERLLEFLDYKCTWLQPAAVVALSKIATDPAHYKTVLPAIVRVSSAFRVDHASYQTSKAISDALKTASPEVKAFASALLKETYASMPPVLAEPNTGAVLGGGGRVVRSRIGDVLRQTPGGEEFVHRIPKTTLASYISGKDEDMYSYDGKFIPNPALVGTWAWAVWPQPANPSEIDKCIANYLKGKKGKDPTKVEGSKDTLQLLDGGKTARSKYFGGYFWSGDMLIGDNDGQALKMELRKVDGVDFLIIEKGGYNVAPVTEEQATAKVPADWHCGFHIYVRQ